MTVSLSGLSELNHSQASLLCSFLLNRIRPVCVAKIGRFVSHIDELVSRFSSEYVDSLKNEIHISAHIYDFIIDQQDTENEGYENLLRAVWEIAKYYEGKQLSNLEGAYASLFDFIEDRIKDLIYNKGPVDISREEGLLCYELVYSSPIYLGEEQLFYDTIEKLKMGIFDISFMNQLAVSLYYLRCEL